MVKRILLSCFIAVFSATSFAGAAMKMAPAKLPDTPVRAEVQFVNSIQADLMKRFPTAADAEKAGYFRYTTEDNTGAISYANLAWQSVDAKHPSQL